MEAAAVTTDLEASSATDTHLDLFVSSFRLEIYLLTAPLICSVIREDFFVDMLMKTVYPIMIIKM